MAGGTPLTVETVKQQRPFDGKQQPVKTDAFVFTDNPVPGAPLICVDSNGRMLLGSPAGTPGGKMYAYDNFT